LQSLSFYVIISWLPEILVNEGFSIVAAGWLVSIAQFVSLPATFFTPVLAEKVSNQSWLAFFAGFMYTTGFAGILFGGPTPLLIFWVIWVGIATGASVSLSLTLIGL